jgi:preprotein translocase subunit YajC
MKDSLMSSFVAAGTTNSGTSSLLIFALPVLLIGWMFLTQRRRQKAAQSLQSSLGVGDEITTTSGLFGTIKALDDKIATVEVSPGVSLRFDRRAIAGPALTASASRASASSTSETDAPSDPTSPTD